jgi:ferrous iron transport protein A
MTYLDKMQPGQKGKVISFNEDSPIVRRLVELGLVPGREITYVRKAPLRDPLEVQIGPICLTLRHAEASMVAVELED